MGRALNKESAIKTTSSRGGSGELMAELASAASGAAASRANVPPSRHRSIEPDVRNHEVGRAIAGFKSRFGCSARYKKRGGLASRRNEPSDGRLRAGWSPLPLLARRSVGAELVGITLRELAQQLVVEVVEAVADLLRDALLVRLEAHRNVGVEALP